MSWVGVFFGCGGELIELGVVVLFEFVFLLGTVFECF